MQQSKLIVTLILVINLYNILNAQDIKQAEIKWDRWGVPHVFGKTDVEVYYGLGWAQMEAHGNLILKAYGKSRGRSTEYWGGEENLRKDELMWKLNIPNRAQQWYNAQNDDMKLNISSFVAGMNDYCIKYPETISEESKLVLPITSSDPLAKLQVSYHLMVGAFALQPQATQWKSAGSNAWAIAPSKSKSGNSMLLMQPHPPWFDDYLFFETHLKSEDLNIYGVTLIGSPSIVMGFNENLGWGLTFNQADAMDLIELEVKDDNYFVNGDWKAFETKTELIKIKKGDIILSETIQIKKSDFGFIVEEKNGKALALRLSGFDRPFFTQQFIQMAKAKNLKTFENALKMLQLPLQNIIYADNQGEIFYLYNGIIPKRPSGTLKEWSVVIPSTKPGAYVNEYIAYKELPKFKNPRSGFVANSNNGPWTSTYPFLEEPKNMPQYIANESFANFNYRSSRSIKMILAKPKLSFDEVVELQSSTHSEYADKTVDELVSFAENTDDSLLIQAGIVLKNWDKKFDTNSKGAVLFMNWYNATKSIEKFQVKFDKNDALNTPNTLTKDAKRKLSEAALITIKNHKQLDIAWGEVYTTNYANKSFKGGLGLSELGSFNAGFYGPLSGTTYTLLGGSAFTSVVEFGKKIKAKGILGYGNSSQTNSIFKGDQIQLLIDRQLRDIWFYESDIEANLFTKEILQF